MRAVLTPFIVAILTLCTGVGAQDRDERVLTRMFDDYERGEHSLVAASVHELSDLRAMRRAIERESEIWIPQTLPALVDRRRLIVAAVAVETVERNGLIDWTAARGIIEWSCTLVRKNSAPTRAERYWHWAALALFQTAADATAVEIHAGHALKRFPDEPRFVLARAVGAELHTWPDERHGRSVRDRDPSSVETVIHSFEKAAEHEAVRGEANLRLGYFYFRLGSVPQALERFKDAAQAIEEPYLGYLLGLFEGRALERTGRLSDATVAFRRAAALLPRAQTAQLALAASLAKQGKRQEAEQIATASLRGGRPAPDPWLMYGQGDRRLWPSIVAGLRKALK
jgi:hypothetical protein